MGNNPSIVDAVKAGSYDANAIDTLLKQNNSPDALDTDGKSALHIVASDGRTDIARVLVSHGANVNQVDSQLNTPLHYAVFTGHHQTAAVIIDGGAEINATNVDSMTPLHYAVQQKAYKCVELLIERGAEGTVRNNKGDTPQDMALHLKQPHRTQMHQLLNSCFAKRLRSGEQHNEKRVHRLVGLCRVWAAVKLIHPYLAHRTNIDWDQTLLDVIDRINDAQSTADYKNCINQLLIALGDKNTRCVEITELQQQHHLLHHHINSHAPTKSGEDQKSTNAAASAAPTPAAAAADEKKPEPDVVPETVNAEPSTTQEPAPATEPSAESSAEPPAELSAAETAAQPATEVAPSTPAAPAASPVAPAVPLPIPPAPKPPVVHFLEVPVDVAAEEDTTNTHSEKVAVVVLTNYGDFAQPINTLIGAFAETKKQKAQVVVFDVRRLDGDGPAYWLSHHFLNSFRMFFVQSPLVMPTVRQRVWTRGEHGSAGPWGVFQGGFITFDAPVLVPEFPPKEFAQYAGVPVHVEEEQSPRNSPATPYKSDTPAKTRSTENLSRVTFTPVKSSPSAPSTPQPSPLVAPRTPATPGSPTSYIASLMATPLPAARESAPVPEPQETIQFLFVVNEGTPQRIIELAAALQAHGTATVVYHKLPTNTNDNTQTENTTEVTVSGGDGAFFELGVSNLVFGLPENLVVFLRKTELVNPDGTLGFWPDVVVDGAPVTQDTLTDAVIKVTVDVATGKRPLPTPGPRPLATAFHAYHPSAPAFTLPTRGKPGAPPPLEVRLLGLFKLWNEVQYFYGYKQNIHVPWDQVLPEFIVRIERAQDALTYGQVLSELISKLNDSHAYCTSPALINYYGTHVPPITVRLVQDATVVTSIYGLPEGTSYQPSGDTSSSRSPLPALSVGDYVLAIDGESVVERRKRIAKLLSASTPQSLNLKVHRALLAGPEKSKCKLEVRSRDGRIYIAEIPRVALLNQNWISGGSSFDDHSYKKLPAFHVLSPGLLYLDLTRLTSMPELESWLVHVRKAEEQTKNSVTVILDLRGECIVSIRNLLSKLGSSREIVGARTRAPFLFPTVMYSDMESSAIEDRQVVQTASGDAWKFDGHIVALVNEETIRNSELACLYLINSGRDVVFVGSTTNGTNGDPTTILLPGGVVAGFSGVGVVRGDGSAVQAVGVAANVSASVTVDGLRNNVDDVLQAAINYAREKWIVS